MWGLDWIEMAQDRDSWRALVNAIMTLRVPQNAANFWTGCKPVSFSRRTVLHGVWSSILRRTDQVMIKIHISVFM
jgi:hypothetical protein